MKPPPDLTDKLNSIEWRKPSSLSATAEQLVQDFLKRLRHVLESVMANNKLSPGEAFDFARTAGPNSKTHQELVTDLFAKVAFRGAGLRETIIFPILSYYSWDEDPQLSSYPNPWGSLIELYQMGYTTDFDVAPDWSEVTLLVGYDDEEKSYRII